MKSDKIQTLLTYIKENLCFFICFILIIIVMNINLPYSVYSPGGLINVDERLKGSAYKSEGSLNLTYVTFMNGKVPNLILALILPEWDIVKNSDITYSNETLIEANKRDKIHLYESISNATYVAYKEAGMTCLISGEEDYVVGITEYAKSNLKIGDKILEVDNQLIATSADLLNYIQTKEINDVLTFKVLRDGKTTTATTEVVNIDDTKKIGISLSKINTYEKEPNIEYQLRTSESGPSGGLMLALAMYNALTEEDITKSLTISGTGTIDTLGNVGEISGIKYKLAGAVKKKSAVFLVPEANYEEAIAVQQKHNYPIKIIKATTFEQVLEELKNL